MPRIPDEFLDSIIYLYPSVQEAERAAVAGGEPKKGGTGFLIGILAKRLLNNVFIYAVTNRHIIKRGNLVIRITTKDGRSDHIQTSDESWVYTQSNDLAVCPIGLAASHKYVYLSDSMLLTKEIILDSKIGIGDDLFVVGRFVNHEGRSFNMPSVRFGNLSMLPIEPIMHGSNTPPFQETFLADIRTVSGYSGSPVFIYPRFFDLMLDEKMFAPATKRFRLLGVEWGHVNDGHRNDTGMSGVVPAWVLRELLDSPAISTLRELADQPAYEVTGEADGVYVIQSLATTSEDLLPSLHCVVINDCGALHCAATFNSPTYADVIPIDEVLSSPNQTS